MHHATGVFPNIQARPCDQDLVSHAGLKTMTTFIDAIGVGHVAEDRLGQFVPTGARHRTGSILGALSVMLIGGGSFVSDLDMLRAHPSVFGRAPSNATISRFFDRIAADGALFEHGWPPWALGCGNESGTLPPGAGDQRESTRRVIR